MHRVEGGVGLHGGWQRRFGVFYDERESDKPKKCLFLVRSRKSLFHQEECTVSEGGRDSTDWRMAEEV